MKILESLEKKAQDRELKIDQIPAGEVKFNMDSYKDLENSFGINFEEQPGIDDKNFSRESQEVLRLDKKFNSLFDRANSLEPELEELFDEVEVVDVYDINGFFEALPTTCVVGGLRINGKEKYLIVIDKDSKNIYCLSQGGDICAAVLEAGYDLEETYVLNVENYEKILNKIEEALNKEGQYLTNLKKEYNGKVGTVIDNL